MFPVDKTDFITMLHDIDYLRFCQDNVMIAKADDFAIKHASGCFGAVVTNIGLRIRKILNLSFDSALPQLTVGQTREVGHQLALQIVLSRRWRALFDKYKVSIAHWFNMASVH